MGGCCSDQAQEVYEDQDEQAGDVEEMLQELGQAEDSSTVVIAISCKNLVWGFVGGLRKPDPKVYVYEVEKEKNFINKTETVPASTDPQFVQTVSLVYQFAAVQKLLFEVCHEEKRGGGRDEQRLIGRCEVKLPTLLEKTSAFTADLVGPTGGKAGTIRLKAEETQKTDGPEHEVLFHFGCRGIESKNMFGAGSSDPFLIISTVTDGSFQPVAKSEYIEGVTECTWKAIVVKLEKLCRGDFNAWILFEVLDWEASGRHQSIGSCKTTLAMMLEYHKKSKERHSDDGGDEVTYELVNEAKVGKEGYLNSGYLVLKTVEVETSHSFLEYVRGGFEINLTICVDFSLSNGKYTSVDSLHYMDDNRKVDNEYVKALRAVVKVLGEYDKDQEFPFYGFGARELQSSDDKVSDIFPVTFDMDNIEVNGIDGVVDAYWKCLDRIEQKEPTNFSACMSKALGMAALSNRDAYQIVLFVTDGAISDLQSTVDVIVECSNRPISVLIIGVGGGPFDHMEYLDGDDKPLVSSDGKMPTRDLVGFVPYQDYKNDPTKLARETLKEIPRQFTKWAKLHKVKPPKRDPAEEKRKEAERRAKEAERERKKKAKALQSMGVELDMVSGDEEGLISAVMTRSGDEPLGLELADLTISGVTPGSPAYRHRFDDYEGYRITHVNQAPVASVQDIGPLIKDLEDIHFTMAPDKEYAEFMESSKPSKRRRHRRHHSKRDDDKKDRDRSRRHRKHPKKDYERSSQYSSPLPGNGSMYSHRSSHSRRHQGSDDEVSGRHHYHSLPSA